MTTDDKYYIEQEFLTSEELVDKVTKTRSLNSIKSKIDLLLDKTDTSGLISKLRAMLLLIEDAYKIDMYQFQFKAFMYALNKEVKNISDYVSKNEI
jgi:hypothetical protein